jgi:hypothetical protein
MTYVERIIGRFPESIEIIRSDEYVSLIWNGRQYSSSEIAEFCGVDEELVIPCNSQISIDIPVEIADEQ